MGGALALGVVVTALARQGCALVLDVSSDQRASFDFAAAAAMGCRAAIIKATDGEGTTDPLFASHMLCAAAAVEQATAYHFFRAWHIDPTIQAREHFEVASPVSMWGPILDVEPTPADAGVELWVVAERAADWCEASNELWAAVGKRGGLFYTFTAHLADLRSSARGLAALQRIRAAGYLLWLADYNGREPAPREGAPWPAVTAWQWTGGAVQVGGVPVDLSWFVGDERALARLGGA
jgi:GH25 family lysozyme M1 (1,4-beta-N-acetylmuramidase)